MDIGTIIAFWITFFLGMLIGRLVLFGVVGFWLYVLHLVDDALSNIFIGYKYSKFSLYLNKIAENIFKAIELP